jgi:ankyrin repeat protein
MAWLLLLTLTGLLSGALACAGTSAWSAPAGRIAQKEAEKVASGGGDPNVIVGDGRPALFAAVQSGDCASAEKLLAGGADTAASWRGWTPLQAAAHRGPVTCADVLLSHGADPNLRVRGAPPLTLAAKRGDAETIRALLAHGAWVGVAYARQLPLQAAAMQGDPDAVRALLEGGADPNAWARGTESPLHLAAARGHDDAAVVLLDAGARLTENPSDPWTTARTYQLAAGRRLHQGAAAAAAELGDIACEYFPQAVPVLEEEGDGREDDLAVAREATAECEERAGEEGLPPPLWKPRPEPL